MNYLNSKAVQKGFSPFVLVWQFYRPQSNRELKRRLKEDRAFARNLEEAIKSM
jgi:hypothetical protein